MFPQDNQQQPTEPPVVPQPPVSAQPADPAQVLPAPASGTGVQGPAKKSKKPLLIAVIAALIVIAVGGGASAMWWTSPQKTFEDSVSSPTPGQGSVKGSLVVKSDTNPTITLNYDSKFTTKATYTDLNMSAEAGMVNFKMTGAVATNDSRSVFFKVNDIGKTLNTLAGGDSETINLYYGKLIDKMDGKWVEMTSSDLKSASSDVDLGCIMGEAQKISQSSAAQNEMKKLFGKYPYATIKEVVGSEKINGSDATHYVMALDEKKLTSYADEVIKTDSFKGLKSCISNFDETLKNGVDKEASSNQPKYEIWVDKWSHQIKKFAITQEESGTKTTLEGTISSDVPTITVPKADTQFKELQAEIESLQNMFMPSSATETDFLSEI